MSNFYRFGSAGGFTEGSEVLVLKSRSIRGEQGLRSYPQVSKYILETPFFVVFCVPGDSIRDLFGMVKRDPLKGES